MKTNKLFLIISISFWVGISEIQSLENSVVPFMEQLESRRNLPLKKYSDKQHLEIIEALNRKDERIRVMSFNMLYNVKDHKLKKSHQWPQRKSRIVELIKNAKPDIIGSQELYQDQLRDLLSQIGNEYAFFSKPASDGELNGIFYRKSRFDVIDSKTWYMTNTPEVPSSETLTLLHLKDKTSDKTVAILNAHLTFSKVNKRDFQVRFIADRIDSIDNSLPLVLTGDLNTFPNRPELDSLPFLDGDYIHRILTRNKMRDAREQSLLGHLGPLSTFTNKGTDVVPFQGLGTPGVFLDHVYISNNITVLIYAVEPATSNGHFPSDHMPIIVDLLLN